MDARTLEIYHQIWEYRRAEHSSLPIKFFNLLHFHSIVPLLLSIMFRPIVFIIVFHELHRPFFVLEHIFVLYLNILGFWLQISHRSVHHTPLGIVVFEDWVVLRMVHVKLFLQFPLGFDMHLVRWDNILILNVHESGHIYCVVISVQPFNQPPSVVAPVQQVGLLEWVIIHFQIYIPFVHHLVQVVLQVLKGL
jgi:hypothetical protein